MVAAAIRKTASGKAVGLDQIPIELLKLTPVTQCVAPLLATAFNRVRMTASLPLVWRRTRGALLPKPGAPNPSLPTAFRPIAVEPHVCKVWDSIVEAFLREHVRARGGIPAQQAAFQTRRGATDHVAALAERILRVCGTRPGETNCAELFVAALDISAAYDRVQHLKMLSVLHYRWGVPLESLRAIRASLENAILVLKGATRTIEVMMRGGVRQGSPLSPFLYILYLSDLVENLATFVEGGDEFVFADDILELALARTSLQAMLDRAEDISQLYFFRFNQRKCVSCRFRVGENGTRDEELPLFRLGGEDLPRTRVLTYLGVTFDSDVTELFSAQSSKSLSILMRAATELIRRWRSGEIRSMWEAVAHWRWSLAGLEYAAVIWVPLLSPRLQRMFLDKAEAIQADVVFALAGVPGDGWNQVRAWHARVSDFRHQDVHRTPKATLFAALSEIGLLPITVRIRQLAAFWCLRRAVLEGVGGPTQPMPYGVAADGPVTRAVKVFSDWDSWRNEATEARVRAESIVGATDKTVEEAMRAAVTSVMWRRAASVCDVTLRSDSAAHGTATFVRRRGVDRTTASALLRIRSGLEMLRHRSSTPMSQRFSHACNGNCAVRISTRASAFAHAFRCNSNISRALRTELECAARAMNVPAVAVQAWVGALAEGRGSAEGLLWGGSEMEAIDRRWFGALCRASVAVVGQRLSYNGGTGPTG
jgi:hypothetical protein